MARSASIHDQFSRWCATEGINTDPGTSDLLGNPSQTYAYLDSRPGMPAKFVALVQTPDGQRHSLFNQNEPWTAPELGGVLGAFPLAREISTNGFPEAIASVTCEPMVLAAGQHPPTVLARKLSGIKVTTLRELVGPDAVKAKTSRVDCVNALLEGDQAELSVWVDDQLDK